MVNRQLEISRTKRVALALAVWGSVATFGVWQYRSAVIATQEQMAMNDARSEGLEAIMADDHYGVITVDTAGMIVDFNPGAERLTGAPEAEAIGKHVGEIVCGELVAKLQQAFAARSADQQSAKVQVVNCDMIGSAVKVRCRIYAARSKRTGEIVGVVLVDPAANVKVDPG